MGSLLSFPEDHFYQQVLLCVSLTVVASLLIHAWVWFVHHGGYFFLVLRNSRRPEDFEQQHPWRRPQRSTGEQNIETPVICPVPQRPPPLDLELEEESRRNGREVGPSPTPVMGYLKDILMKLDRHIKTAYFRALQRALVESIVKELPLDQPLDPVHMGCVDVRLEEQLERDKWVKRAKAPHTPTPYVWARAIISTRPAPHILYSTLNQTL